MARIFKYISILLVSQYCFLIGSDLEDFAGYWTGTESLASPSTSYQSRPTYIFLRHNDLVDNNLIYTSNSNFIYNAYLDWADHYFTYDKTENQVTYERRFMTPLGILGSQNLVYNIIEVDDTRILLEYISNDGLTIHSLSISSSMLSNNLDIYPKELNLGENYPNPFNPITFIPVKINKKVHASIEIYNMSGQFVQRIQSGHLEPGSHIFEWNGKNYSNVNVSAGTYIYRLLMGDKIISKKMILLK